MNCFATRTPLVSPESKLARILSFTGAGVSPSPSISVVTPWVTLLMTRPSPVSSCSSDCPWMSMKPGATTIPFASMRLPARASASVPTGAMIAIRSPRSPTSP